MSSLYDFMSKLALQMGKKPQDMENFVKILEDNWFDTVDSLKTISDDQWKDLKLPLGLVNAIKKNLGCEVEKPQAKVEEVKMEIDTTTQPVISNQARENLIRRETSENCLSALSDLQTVELGENKQQLRDTLKTLFLIVSNLMQKSLDPQVRRINKTGKAAQMKILPFNNAIRFLKIVRQFQKDLLTKQIGFDFDRNVEFIELSEYRKEVFEEAIEALNAHIMSLGGTIEGGQKFDPYKSAIASTNFDRMPVRQTEGLIDVYDPTIMGQEIQKLKQEKQRALEETIIKDRDIRVFNISHTGQNLKSYLMELDMQEAERLKKLQLTEDKLDQQIEQTSALKFLADVEKSTHFKNKRQEELERLKKQPIYNTALVRIKFPDDYVLQGTFGGLERMENIYQFVKEHLFDQKREFNLYETPPKKILNNMKQTVKQARLVPSGMLYFAWNDLDQTKNTDGPFLDIASLKDKIIAF